MTNYLTRGVDWNNVTNPLDLEVWNKLISNFWVPEKIALSNDLKSWNLLDADEKLAVTRVFAGLTLLDTIQGTVGAPALLKDSRTLHEESVFANISFMEAFAAGTELLTPEGWKNIEDVTEEDKVAQYDPETNGISFAAPKLVDPHFSPEVYEIVSNNGNGRQIVSGGHRVYLEEKVKKNNSCTEWVGKVYEARDLENVNLNSAHRRFRSAGLAPSRASSGMTAEDRLKVAIQADGSFLVGSTPRYTGELCGFIPTYFLLTKLRKQTRLSELAQHSGWGLRDKGFDGRGQHKFILETPPTEVGGRTKKFKDWWKLDEITLEWARDFVEELGLWDGHTLKGGNGVTYYTVEKDNADFAVAVATLAGYRSRTTVRVDDRKESYRDCYVVNITVNKDTVNSQSMSVRPVDPQMVYCVQVPTTYLVTRNGESPIISGNCVHAKSYSYIFQTLNSSEEIEDAFDWSEANEYLQAKAKLILDYYDDTDEHKKKIASTMLESFLFYSGFYLPLYYASKGKLTNTADIIRLILRDESVHGYYIGQLYQQRIPEDRREELEDFTYDLVSDIMSNEIKYAQSLYDSLGLTEDVNKFMRYNANKALMNLGYEPIYSREQSTCNPAVLTALSLDSENHDFFSGSGSSYAMAEAVDTEDDDWDF